MAKVEGADGDEFNPQEYRPYADWVSNFSRNREIRLESVDPSLKDKDYLEYKKMWDYRRNQK